MKKCKKKTIQEGKFILWKNVNSFVTLTYLLNS